MIIYSPMPDEKIFAGIESYQPKYVDLHVGGVDMQVEMIGDRQAKIVRLYSADPAHYIDARYAPGRIIEFQPRWR
jgi:hypothetical protein